MNLNERYRKFPIKFYKNEEGVYWENSFLSGQAKDLNDAFNQIKDKNLDKELWYYYDDVQDIKIGNFEPAIKERNTKHGIYIGKLNLSLDINDYTGEHTVKYLSENPDKIKDHEKFIKKIKDTEKRQKFINDLKSGLKKVSGFLTGQVVEMFSPYKTREDLICTHCGDIIPKGCYYEEWHKEPYHLECIWDKLSNDTKSNEHENCIEYFLSLQELNPWPGDFDSQDTYISDLELFKVNKRLGLVEEAASMYRTNQPTFKEFYEYVIKNPKAKKSYFSFCNGRLRMPSDTILHDYNKHNMTLERWDDLLSNILNIQNSCISNKKISNNEMLLLRILGYDDYGLSLMCCPNYFQITSGFFDKADQIDNWIKMSSARTMANNPPSSLGNNPKSVVLPGQQLNNIIQQLKDYVKPLTESIDNWIKEGSSRLLASQLPAPRTLKRSSVTHDNDEPNNIITYIKNKIKR